MYQQTTKDTSAIAYHTTDGIIRPEVQTITNVYRPLQAESYAPIPQGRKGDPLPLFIGSGLLLALVAMAGIHFADGEKRELQAQNAQYAAQQAAIAGCINGVMKQ